VSRSGEIGIRTRLKI